LQQQLGSVVEFQTANNDNSNNNNNENNSDNNKSNNNNNESNNDNNNNNNSNSNKSSFVASITDSSAELPTEGLRPNEKEKASAPSELTLATAPATLQQASPAAEVDRSAVTVVTAYYTFKSKHSTAEYAQWILSFLRISAPVYMFSNFATHEAVLARLLHQAGKPNVHLHLREMGEFHCNTLGIDWAQQHSIDKEARRHTPELYQVWTERCTSCKQQSTLICSRPSGSGGLTSARSGVNSTFHQSSLPSRFRIR